MSIWESIDDMLDSEKIGSSNTISKDKNYQEEELDQNELLGLCDEETGDDFADEFGLNTKNTSSINNIQANNSTIHNDKQPQANQKQKLEDSSIYDDILTSTKLSDEKVKPNVNEEQKEENVTENTNNSEKVLKEIAVNNVNEENVNTCNSDNINIIEDLDYDEELNIEESNNNNDQSNQKNNGIIKTEEDEEEEEGEGPKRGRSNHWSERTQSNNKEHNKPIDISANDSVKSKNINNQKIKIPNQNRSNNNNGQRNISLQSIRDNFSNSSKLSNNSNLQKYSNRETHINNNNSNLKNGNGLLPLPFQYGSSNTNNVSISSTISQSTVRPVQSQFPQNTIFNNNNCINNSGLVPFNSNHNNSTNMSHQNDIINHNNIIQQPPLLPCPPMMLLPNNNNSNNNQNQFDQFNNNNYQPTQIVPTRPQLDSVYQQQALVQLPHLPLLQAPTQINTLPPVQQAYQNQPIVSVQPHQQLQQLNPPFIQNIRNLNSYNHHHHQQNSNSFHHPSHPQNMVQSSTYYNQMPLNQPHHPPLQPPPHQIIKSDKIYINPLFKPKTNIQLESREEIQQPVPVQSKKSTKTRKELDLLLEKRLSSLKQDEEIEQKELSKYNNKNSSTNTSKRKSTEMAVTPNKLSNEKSSSSHEKKKQSDNQPPPKKLMSKIVNPNNEKTKSSTRNEQENKQINPPEKNSSSSNCLINDVIIDDPDYIKKLEEQKKRREQILKEKEEKRTQRAIEILNKETNGSALNETSNLRNVVTNQKGSKNITLTRPNQRTVTASSITKTRKIHIQNLAANTSDRSLINMCNQINLKDKLVKVEKKKNEAFILFADHDSADQFLKKYNRTLVDLSTITIRIV